MSLVRLVRRYDNIKMDVRKMDKTGSRSRTIIWLWH